MYHKLLSKIIILLSCVSLCLTNLNFVTVSATTNINFSDMKVESTGGINTDLYVTGYLSETGEIVIYQHVGSERAGIGVTIAVFVGGALVGYITGSIIDGIVVEVTGKTGTEWAQYAIREVVGRRYYKGMSVHLSCSIYPPNSYAGAKCKG